MIDSTLRPPRPARVIRPAIPSGRRVIAISDIHGNLPFLKGVLEKVRFTPADVLVLVGDLFEKGEDSIGVLRYVMELRRTHTVYPLCGNCDHIDKVFLEGEPGTDESIWHLVECWGRRFLPAQLGLELGLAPPRSPADLPALRRALLEGFPEECAFLLDLPQILEAGRFIFVHGGIPREDRLDELDAYGCMKNDDFLGQGHSFHKWVVVGHWPVTLYDPDVTTGAPLILPERHIASIDGGCVLNSRDGQLNALIIPDIMEEALTWAAYDGLPRVRALDGQMACDDSVNICWSDSVVEELRVEGDCTLCRHPSTGREMWIPTEYISTWADGRRHTDDISDYRLPVERGDELGLVFSCDRGCIAKKDGVVGWYHGGIEHLPERASLPRGETSKCP